MANLQDRINNYLAEADGESNKVQAAKQIAQKLRKLRYTGSETNIPKADLLRELRVVKGSANDSHLEVLDAVIAELESGAE